ncbi:heavy metal translocating P-type ATPase [Halomarina oriensis]|uniref:Cadmium-translocating P-type ATPase n=1 Tax=Halomarina oriensis TaxID=671145 RepID=A0A6B0GIL9_9EURY|nr:heavy metal translocating P-type ATPase [Halomarina oriensis]MWG34722.1 cadmium-translocating P-type ATPase [Halomarina oriensis]
MSDESESASTGRQAVQETVTLSVPEMDCPSCAEKVTKSVKRLDGLTEVTPKPTTGTLSVAYDPATTSREAIVDRVENAGYKVENSGGHQTAKFTVPEMDCASCAGKVENALGKLDGVTERETRPTAGTVSVTYDSSKLSHGEIIAAIEGAGYEVTNADGTSAETDSGGMAPPSDVWTSSRAMKTWASGAFVAIGLLVEFILTGLNTTVVTVLEYGFTVADVALLLAVAFAGVPVVRNGYYSAKNLNLDIDLLMGTAIIGATAIGLYEEAATLAFLFSIAELMETYSMDRARNSLRELMDLSPDEATVRRDGEERTIPVDEVEVGDTVIVRPGEKIPVDGQVIEGESAVNQAPITGESVPVDKTTEDEVFAGTINEDGYLEVRATSAASDTTIAKIVEMVEDAQSNKTEREQFVERFADYYTPIVVGLAILTMTIPPLAFGLGWQTWFVRGLTLLVISCPCAFVISTPVSVVSAITSAAKNGVLIKGGNHLEAMGAVEAVATDKTGTLTKGELTVTDVVPLNGNAESDVLRTARSLEQRSEHPIATAIIDHAEDADVAGTDVTDFESITGKGVRATLDDTTYYAGKPGLFKELGLDLDHSHYSTDGGVAVEGATERCDRGECVNLHDELVPKLQAEGKTIVVVGTDHEVTGLIAIADEVRPEAKRAVEKLQEQGVEVVMLTGDNERTAQAIAQQLGIDDYRGELLPEEKVSAIEELKEEYDGVAMVGDGINDAPALATATVGIAMGAAGTDTAIETADIALMGDDLAKLPYLYGLSHKANGVIRQNIWSSLGVKFLLALGVPLGYVSVALAVLVGDMGMSIGVTGNAMRLSRLTPERFR